MRVNTTGQVVGKHSELTFTHRCDQMRIDFSAICIVKNNFSSREIFVNTKWNDGRLFHWIWNVLIQYDRGRIRQSDV